MGKVWWGYRAAGKMVSGGGRAGNRMGQGLGQAYQARRAANIGSREASRGWLAPGDPTPAPTVTADYKDYRGTATASEMAALTVPGGFALGSFVDFQNQRITQPLSIPEEVMNRHALIVGPAGSGKTSGLIVPWIVDALCNDWSVVAIDVKGDLADDVVTFARRVSAGEVEDLITRWDFSRPETSCAWDWMAELTTEARLDAAVTAILGRQNTNSSADPYFYQRDYRLLRGLLSFAHAVSPHTRTAGQLIRMLQNDGRLQNAVLANRQAPGAGELLDALRHPTSEYVKVVSGVVTALAMFDSTGASAVTAARQGTPRLELEATLDENKCLIVGAPMSGGQMSATLSSLLFNQLAQRLYERFEHRRRRTLLVIDEAPRVADRVDLEQLMAVSRSAGVGVVLAVQDVAQFKDENQRSSLVTNASTLALLPGASAVSVESFAKRLGMRPEQAYAMQSTGGWNQAPGQSLSTQMVPVLGEREIMEPPAAERPAVVHVKASQQGVTSKPFVVELLHET